MTALSTPNRRLPMGSPHDPDRWPIVCTVQRYPSGWQWIIRRGTRGQVERVGSHKTLIGALRALYREHTRRELR